MTTKKTKKKNPQDSTLRNITALKKRVTVLELKLDTLLDALSFLASKKR